MDAVDTADDTAAAPETVTAAPSEVIDPEDWSSGDPETARAMVNYLLDELQPQLWTKRKDAISTFADYFFRTHPVLPDLDIEGLMLGDTSRKGLLYTCGQLSWKSFRLKRSSFSALDLLIDLLNPERNREAAAFVRVFVRLEESAYRSIKLQKHLSSKATKSKAMYIINLLHRHNRSVPLDDNDEPGAQQGDGTCLSEPAQTNIVDLETKAASYTGASGANGTKMNISNIVSKLSNFLARRPQMQTLMRKGIVHAPMVFGRKLSDVVAESNVNGVPTFFVRCCEFLREHGIDKVGIFRVSGHQQEVHNLKHMIDYSEKIVLDGASPHSIAGIVKLFVRELPEPLLTFDRYDEMVKAAREEDWDGLDKLADTLPQPNLAVFKYLCEFLAEVSLKMPVNKMTPANLAIVFAPNLMRSAVESFEFIALNTPVTISAVKHFIERTVIDLAAHSEDVTVPEIPDTHGLPLLAPWIEYLDESTGVPFYYNPETGDSCWDRPVVTDVAQTMVNSSEPTLLVKETEAKAADGQQKDLAPSAPLSKESSPEPNQDSDILKPTPSGALSSKSDLPDGWEEFHDEATGSPYFYNRQTGTSLWDRPTAQDNHPPPPPPSATPSEPSPPHQNEVTPPEPKNTPAETTKNTPSETTMKFRGSWTSHTAGGCFPNVTWFRNPQYFVRVSSQISCVVRIDLSMVGTVTSPIGIHVVHVPSDRSLSDGRILTIPSEENLLAIGPFDCDLSAIASVEVQIPASSNEDFTQLVVVPSTEFPGTEGRFELSVVCGPGCSVSEIVDESADGQGWRCVQAEGDWLDNSAGGCYPNFMTWRDNPQFRLDLGFRKGSTRALIHLKREDDDGEGAIGFYVLKNSGPAVHKMSVSDGDVVMRSEFITAGDVVAEVLLESLDGDQNAVHQSFPYYVILPCSYAPNTFDKFHLSVFSNHDLNLSSIPENKRWTSTSCQSSWTASNSGGCRNFSTWKNNPQFKLFAPNATPALIVLSQSDAINILPIGFYVLNRLGKVRGKGPFMVAPEVHSEIHLDPTEGPYSLFPCTFNPGQVGDFVVRLFTTTPVKLEPRIQLK